MTASIGDYRAIAAEKRLQRSDRIPRDWLIDPELYRGTTNVLHVPATCGILDTIELDITSNHDATALLEKLKGGLWSAEQVTLAFCKRAAVAQQLVNCLTEILFDEAINRARDLDIERAKHPNDILPPFWGLPISLKDSFDIRGHDTSTGLACYVNEPAKENSSLAAMLLDLGAVLYCKSNLPQSIMTADSDNNVFGRTLNPQNAALTAGGSTGGEGALIALRGSIVGVGTDIGGSLRVPAVCNGIYGFRPSAGVVPHDGVRNLTAHGNAGVRSSAGPMATSIRDCSLFLKTMMEGETWRYDSTVTSLPWTYRPIKSKLRVGVVEDDGMFTPSPPVRRGLKLAMKLLRDSSQFELVPMTLSNLKDHYYGLLQYFSLSGSDYYQEQFARTGEPQVPSLQAINLLNFQGTDLKGLIDLNARRAATAKQYLHLFLDNKIDAILMPSAPHTAVPLDTWKTASYTGIWNYLDFPAVVIPVDEVRDSDAADELASAKYGSDDAKAYSLYTGPKLYRGAPVCVQLVGYRHADEALASTATVIDSLINRTSMRESEGQNLVEID